MRAISAAAGAAALMLAGGLGTTADAALCSSLNASISYADFTSCTVSGGGPARQDNFANVNSIVTALFGDEGITISTSGSYSPGPGTGGEFSGDDAGAGFDIQQGNLNTNSFTFLSLPADTIFISLKQGNGFELFGIPGLLPFTLTHSLNGNATSHISTFAGSGVPTDIIPLPATALLLLGGIGALGALRARRAA